ncbi:MAG: hypothetical protein ABSG53_04295 [Thermoguttaceae bacterium]
MIILISPSFACTPASPHRRFHLICNFCFSQPGPAVIAASHAFLQHRFRAATEFGIRTLLVLTVAVALPFSWLGVRMTRAREQKEAAAELEKSSCLVAYDWWTVDADGEPDMLSSDGEPPGPVWLRDLLGVDYFSDVVSVYFDDGADDATPLEPIESLARIKVLWLNAKVTDNGLERLKGLTELRKLGLSGSKITNVGLEHLQGLRRLRLLDLSETWITDAGLQSLNGLTHLEKLYLSDTTVTDGSVEKLQQALPNCKIIR